MKVQDEKGNVLWWKSFLGTIKQYFCLHEWIKVGLTYECPKCLSTKSDEIKLD